jgi:serine protease Do
MAKMKKLKRSELFFLTVFIAVFMGLFGAVLGVWALEFGFLGSGGVLSAEDGGGIGTVSSPGVTFVDQSQAVEAIAGVTPAVVSIVASKDVVVGPYFAPQLQRADIGGGTGFIVNNGGFILTNKHVVADSDAEYKVVLEDGREYLVDVLSVDPFDDIAVLGIVGHKERGDLDGIMFADVEFGDSDALQVGQPVYAIGNALSLYGNTVSSGIVSALGRDVFVYDESAGRQENLSGLIQTDAAINLGSSGGPIINLDGEVVAMSVAVADANGIGFAIPVNDLKPIVDSMGKYGKIVRPVLGARFLILNPAQARELGVSNGAILVSGDKVGERAVQKGGPADEAGLREGDVILSVDGNLVSLERPLHKMIRQREPGDEVSLKLWRDGKELEVEVELGERS